MRLALLALLMTVPGHAIGANLIGLEVPPYPDDLKDTGGACVGGPPNTSDICDYSIGTLTDSKGKLFLYAGKFIGRGDNGKPRWLITDVMPYPKLPKGYQVAISTCRQNGVDDRTIFAIVKMVDEEWYRNIARAYKLDIKQQRFVSIGTKGIECGNEGWGV